MRVACGVGPWFDLCDYTDSILHSSLQFMNITSCGPAVIMHGAAVIMRCPAVWRVCVCTKKHKPVSSEHTIVTIHGSMITVVTILAIIAIINQIVPPTNVIVGERTTIPVHGIAVADVPAPNGSAQNCQKDNAIPHKRPKLCQSVTDNGHGVQGHGKRARR